jgi:hypothetical protein
MLIFSGNTFLLGLFLYCLLSTLDNMQPAVSVSLPGLEIALISVHQCFGCSNTGVIFSWELIGWISCLLFLLYNVLFYDVSKVCFTPLGSSSGANLSPVACSGRTEIPGRQTDGTPASRGPPGQQGPPLGRIQGHSAARAGGSSAKHGA